MRPALELWFCLRVLRLPNVIFAIRFIVQVHGYSAKTVIGQCPNDWQCNVIIYSIEWCGRRAVERACQQVFATACCLHSDFNFTNLRRFELIADISEILMSTDFVRVSSVYGIICNGLNTAWHDFRMTRVRITILHIVRFFGLSALWLSSRQPSS